MKIVQINNSIIIKIIVLSLTFSSLLSNSFAQFSITNNGINITNTLDSIYVIGQIVNQTNGKISNHEFISINGSVNNQDSGLIDNFNTINIAGSLVNQGDGRIYNNQQIEINRGVQNQNNGFLLNDGNIIVNGSIQNQSNGFFKNSGVISVVDSITNNANNSFCDSTQGSFIINGTKAAIGGTTPITFFKLRLNISDTLGLNQSVKVFDTLDMYQGNVFLNGNVIDLTTTGRIVNECDSTSIFGVTGKVRATRQINNPTFNENIAGLGLRIASNNNHGLTIVERFHNLENAADTSIYRNFVITPQNVASIDSIRVSYFSSERIKLETNYKIFIRDDDGSSGWRNMGGIVKETTPKDVTTKLNFELDTMRITISDQNCTVLPLILIGLDTITGIVKTIDTLTCLNDTLSFLAFSNVPNSLISWTVSGDTAGVEYPNPMIVSIAKQYDVRVIDGVNGCANTGKINVSSDFATPYLFPFVDTLFLNCSQTTVLLNDTNNYDGQSLMWNGDNAYSSSNPALVNLVGYYCRVATRLRNGCTSTDSVYVGYKPDLELVGSNDTLVCKFSPVSLSVSPIGNVSNINYAWSLGGNGQQINVSTAETMTYVVTATTPSQDCIGIDSVVVNISPDITDSISTYVSCDGTDFGTVKIDASGGTPPLSYSITNGDSYFSTNVFEHVPYGFYSVVIKDTVGCTKSNSAILNGFSDLPVAQFIASTSNTVGDTIVLVDISKPTRPDSVHWQFSPDIATIIGGDEFNPIIFVPDTASITITMIGYWGNCVIDTTKLVHFGSQDTTTVKNSTNKGIKSVKLYPNPNSGTFTVEVEFYKEQNSSVQVWDTRPSSYFQQNFTSLDYLNIPITLPPTLMPGAYVIRIIGEYDTRNVHFIISK